MHTKNHIFAHSKRLLLRRIEDNDFDAIFSYRNDPEVGKYQSWTDKTENQIHALIQEQKSLQPGQSREWFMFAIQLKKENIMIGDCAFNINHDYPEQAEIGVTLARPFQGNNYAKEAVTCAINYIFEHFPVDRIVMITYKDNLRSISLIKNLELSLVNPSIGFKNAPADKDLFKLKNNELMYEIVRKR